jgi:hypothetical protein
MFPQHVSGDEKKKWNGPRKMLGKEEGLSKMRMERGKP